MKKGKLLIALVALLVITTGSLVAVNASKEAKAKQEAEASTSNTSTSNFETLVEAEKQDIKQITITDSEGTITFLPTEEKWAIEGAPDVELNTSLINSTCSNLLTLSASRTFEEPDLNEFGLINATTTLTYTLNSGEVIEFLLGGTTLEGTAAYALKDGNKNTAYLLSSYDTKDIVSSLDKFRITTLDSFDPAAFRGLTASGKDLETFKVESSDTATNLSTYVLSSPGTKMLNLDSQALDNLIASLPTFEVEEFIADEVTD